MDLPEGAAAMRQANAQTAMGLHAAEPNRSNHSVSNRCSLDCIRSALYLSALFVAIALDLYSISHDCQKSILDI